MDCFIFSHIHVKSKNKFLKTDSYFFCVHPHGIFSFGALCTFIPERAGIREILPNVEPQFCCMKLILMIPVIREVLLRLGFVSVSSESLRYLASNGLSAMLVIGGVEESLFAYPGSTELILKKRKGFVRIALETGAQLVPVYVLGENDLFDQVHGLRKLQRWLQKRMTFAIPLLYGRFYLPIPYRRRLTTVVGNPIPHPTTGSSEERVSCGICQSVD
jgi:2-acylglycerol O-acyltransferase 2